MLAYQSTDDAREAAKWEREQALSFAYATVATCVEVFFVVILIYSAVSSRHYGEDHGQASTLAHATRKDSSEG